MRWIVRHAAWLIPRFRGSEVQSPTPSCHGRTVPWKTGGVWRNSSCTHIFQRSERDLEIQHPKLADRWKPGVWLGKSDLTDEHLVRTDDGAVYARSVRRLAENSWSEENLKAVVETPQKPRSMTTDDAADPRVVPEVQ